MFAAHNATRLAKGAGYIFALVACSEGRADVRPLPATGGNAARGLEAMTARGCGTCHVIPGVPGAVAKLAPPLTAWSKRTFVAGELANVPDQLVRWLVDPQSIHPRTAMPNLGLERAEARDMAAYLYTLE